MKTNTLFTFLLAFCFALVGNWQSAFAQASLACWDFEEACSQPAYAFNVGCIPDARAAIGTPDVNSTGLPAFSGSKFAAMTGCIDSGNLYGEGFTLSYGFAAGTKYTITFAVAGGDDLFLNSPQLNLHMVSDMPNVSGTPIGGICGNPGYMISSNFVPASAQQIGSVSAHGLSNTSWKTVSFTYTPTANANQLLFIPNKGDVPLAATANYSFKVDKVCIRQFCDPLPFNVNMCMYEGSDVISATITGVNVPQDKWRMWHANDCNGGVLTPNFGDFEPINWTGPNTFELAPNSGCYVLLYISHEPGCSMQLVRKIIDTNTSNIPACTGPCDDWLIRVVEEPCETVFFEIESNQIFPSGTTITATMNGEPVEQIIPGLVEYDPIVMGGDREVWVCFTVNQPNCPTITQCERHYVQECQRGPRMQGIDNEPHNALEELVISNPANDKLQFSQALEKGTAQLYNLQGQLMKQVSLDWTKTILVSDLPAGAYLLRLTVGEEQVARLIAIQH